MPSTPTGPGAIESAIRGHYPTQAVLFEASALDRELAYDPPCWEALLRSIESFSTHYPAVLLLSPNAVSQLGQACLEGIHLSPGLALKAKSANLLVDMLRGVMNEVTREGPDRIPQSIPRVIGRLLNGLLEDPSWMTQLISMSESQLVPPLLLLGKQILLVISEGTFQGEWDLLVHTLAKLLIKLIQHRVEGEPFYDGRWDHGEISGQLAVALLEEVRKEYIQRDMNWLAAVENRLEAGQLSEVDAFLELAAYTNRDERERAWEAWFGVLAATGSSGSLSVETLQELFGMVGQWITTIQDRRFLSRLAASLRHTAVTLAKSGQELGLESALETIGQAVSMRLEKEVGRGDIDLTSSRLRTVVAELIGSYLDRVEETPKKNVVDLCLSNRTGPLDGHPVSRDDVIWRMQMAVKHNQVAEQLLLSMITGFSLEELVLQEEGSRLTNHTTLSQTLGEMLGCSWQRNLLHLVRTIVRIMPLSPLHLGNTSTYSHLMALDPEDRHGSFLHDLKEKVLAGTGKENLFWVESVLWFWSTGKPEYLGNLVCPENMTTLPAEAERQHTDHIRHMIQRLRQHAPVTSVGKQGVEWLGHMPQSYYNTNTLLKVAGFQGCSSKAVANLFHLLNIYRDLLIKFRKNEDNLYMEEMSIRELLQHTDDLLLMRKDLADRLFTDRGLEGLKPTERLELFGRDLNLLMKSDRALGQLAWRCRHEKGTNRLEQGAKIVSRMLANATVSGLGSRRWDGLIKRCIKEPLHSDQIAQLRRLVTSLRSKMIRKLRPYVMDSVLRLRKNPFSRPTSSYVELVGSNRFKDTKELVEEISRLLADDLLTTDGGLLGLENFLRYLSQRT